VRVSEDVKSESSYFSSKAQRDNEVFHSLRGPEVTEIAGLAVLKARARSLREMKGSTKSRCKEAKHLRLDHRGGGKNSTVPSSPRHEAPTVKKVEISVNILDAQGLHSASSK